LQWPQWEQVGVRYACLPCQTSATDVATHVMPCGLCHFGCALPFAPHLVRTLFLPRRNAVKSEYGKHVGLPHASLLYCVASLVRLIFRRTSDADVDWPISFRVPKRARKFSASISRLVSFHALKMPREIILQPLAPSFTATILSLLRFPYPPL
jgi:hypothetical protein